jgi:CheY-like chemotaxis protein
VVADDNAFIRDLLASELRTRFSVKKAVANGQQLVGAALAGTPDVIVSDVSMPVLGGVAAMLALRSLGRNIPFVMVSADPDHADECLRQGAAAFVYKRDLLSELIPAVLAAIAGSVYVSAGAAAASRGLPL